MKIDIIGNQVIFWGRKEQVRLLENGEIRSSQMVDGVAQLVSTPMSNEEFYWFLVAEIRAESQD